MFVKIMFGASIILSGLFLALPEMTGFIANYGSGPYTVGRFVGILAIIFEGWWIIRKIKESGAGDSVGGPQM
ncbi:hypothetical protein HY838_00140 [Candidatus Azambacteria bacterium]|nr:hypothetical protein [Candidatus Azambacteria bacterium]